MQSAEPYRGMGPRVWRIGCWTGDQNPSGAFDEGTMADRTTRDQMLVRGGTIDSS
jgi:hypothetical protein